MKQLFASLSVLLLAASAHAEGVDIKAAPLHTLSHKLGLPVTVTNSILTSWLVTILFLVVTRLVIGRTKTVPGRAQGVAETVLEGLKGLYEPIIGKKAMPWAFPVVITLFFFILIHNWSGLIPGVGTIGIEKHDASGHEHFIPYIRPHTADFNGTLALAIVSFVAWLIIIFRYAGPGLIAHDIFGNKADKKELAGYIYWPLSLIFLGVGFIELISIAIRPLTLSVRLFGNVFGGENLLHATSFTPPFYFMELLVGLVQAIVFTLLTSVYIGLICNHGDDHGDEHH